MFTFRDIAVINKTIRTFPVGTELSIAKIKGNTVEYYGGIKAERCIETIQNENAVFEIGSITKLFTSTVLAQMVEEQQIKLDESIALKLGFPLKNKATISYKALATHSSGLPSIPFKLLISIIFGKKDNPYRNFNEEKLIHYLKNELKLKKEGVLRYSNLGIGLLGYILAKHSKQSYDAMLKERLFKPLKMNNTTTIREEIKENLVTGLDKKGRPAKNWDLNILAGAGAVLSSSTDLSKYILANIQGRDTAMNLQRQCVYEKGKQAMGLAWFILRDKIPGVEKAYFHSGGTGGYRSSVIADFSKGNGVIVLSNVSGLYLLKGNQIDLLSFNLLQLMS